MTVQWRKCNFFDEYKDELKNDKLQDLKDINIASCSSGHGLLILGDISGLVHKIDRGFNIFSFRAYELNLSFVYQLKQSNVLITIGEDESGINPLVKVWNLDKFDKNGNPLCTRITRAIPNNKPTPVTCITCHENLNYFAIGFQNGSVILFTGDVMRERGSKQKIIHDGSTQITGLKFKSTPKGCFLFIVSLDDVWSYNVQSKDRDNKVKLDNYGCSSSCVTLSDPKSDELLYLAKNDAVYCYTHDSRGPCYAFGGEKLILHWYRNYLVVLSKETKVLTPNSTSIRESSRPEEFVLTIYDIQNKLTAFVCTLNSPLYVLSEWGSLFVYSADKTIVEFLEKDTQSKLQALFKKNLYDIAIRLSKTMQFDGEGLAEIFRQYGDHLYSKGDFNGAIDQYIKTIGKLEAAYVVRKFLDSQRIHNLTAYLEALHCESLATEDHTTLLLNCYTKLKDKNKLDQFIMNTDKSVVFDVELAIRVCRQSGYPEHALRLAKQHGIHHLYLLIQIEDLANYKGALDYVKTLDLGSIHSNLNKYGSFLMTHAPADTTDLIKSLFDPNERNKNEDYEYHPTDYLHLFVEHKNLMKDFVETAIKFEPSATLYHTLFELYIDEYSHTSDPQVKHLIQTNIMDLLRDQNVTYDSNQLLVFFKTTDFTPGILYLYERVHFYYQILQYHMERHDHDNVLITCRKYSSQDPTLWVKALWYFINVTSTDFDRYIKDVLREIEIHKLLPPIMVVEILMKSPVANLGLAREYLMRTFEKENTIIGDDLKIISQYKKETNDITGVLNEIQTSVVKFQGSKCNICNNSLSLPSVHFLCQHSFHQHCFTSYCENDNECPACLPQNKKLLEIIRSQDRRKDFHEQFHTQLEKSNDVFSVVSDFLGRGAFNNVIIVNELKPASKVLETQSKIENSASTQSESRLRLAEVKHQPTVNIPSEGRLRMNVNKPIVPVSSEGRLRLGNSHQPISTPSEGRLRLGAGNQTLAAPSEGRLRLGIGNQTLAIPSEGRLRSGVASSPVLSVTPEARMRSNDKPGQNDITNKSGSPFNKSASPINKSASPINKSASPINKSPVPANKQIQLPQPAEPSNNPFDDDDVDDDYDDSKNPFSSETNPFDEDDDYDSSLNPFS